MLSITTPDAPAYTVNPDKIHASVSQDSAEPQKKKKKKRHREEDAAANGEGQPKEKKKKRKHHERSEDAIEPQEPTPATTTPPVDASSAEPAPIPKKKKKKDKGKQRADVSLSEPTDAQIEADSQASAAALLSAIVAASVTNPESQQVNQQTPFAQNAMPPAGGQQFMPFPPMQYGYPPGAFDPTVPQAANMFAPPGGAAFSELAFGSNEDLLRALQDLDMSKIANVLKTIGDASNPGSAAGGSSLAPQLGFMPTQLEQGLPQPPSSRSSSAPSNALLDVPSRQQHVQPFNMPVTAQHGNAKHAHILANKWLTASKLTEMVAQEGLVYKKGKFSTIEEAQVKEAIARYQVEKGLTDMQINELIFTKSEQGRDNAFWSEITTAVPLRPIIAVYHYVRRKYHPMRKQGPWSDEEDAKLRRAVADLGQQWEKICFRVGRMASDCRDRYRNHIVGRETRVTGHWSKEEEEKLIEIVTNMTIKQGRDPDNDVFWGKVSELMGGTRGRQQCRIKWTDALSKTVKNKGEKPRWSPQDAFILVHKIDSLNVTDDSEIDWKMLSDPDWNLWSAHAMQRRWLTLKRSIKGWEQMTHQEIMEILRVKKAHLPPPLPVVTPKKPKRKVTSAETVDDDPSLLDSATPESGSDAGSPEASSSQ